MITIAILLDNLYTIPVIINTTHINGIRPAGAHKAITTTAEATTIPATMASKLGRKAKEALLCNGLDQIAKSFRYTP